MQKCAGWIVNSEQRRALGFIQKVVQIIYISSVCSKSDDVYSTGASISTGVRIQGYKFF